MLWSKSCCGSFWHVLPYRKSEKEGKKMGEKLGKKEKKTVSKHGEEVSSIEKVKIRYNI